MSEAEFAAYDRAEKTHWWFRARRRILGVFIELIPARPAKAILEIGCGSGGNLELLFTDFGKRVGLEHSPHAIAYARRKIRPGDEVVEGDANKPPFADESFDCVAMLDVLYHQAIPEPQVVLAAAYRMLRPGGFLLIADGAFDFLAGSHSESVGSARRFTRPGLVRLVQGAGFEVVRASYWGVVLFALLFVKRVLVEGLLRFLGRPPAPHSFDIVEVPVLDPILHAAVSAEAPLLRHVDLPIGASLALLGRKK